MHQTSNKTPLSSTESLDHSAGGRRTNNASLRRVKTVDGISGHPTRDSAELMSVLKTIRKRPGLEDDVEETDEQQAFKKSIQLTASK